MKPNIGQGDKGTTSLFGGTKVDKDNLQVESYGNIDELNSNVGLIRSFNENKEIDSVLETIQNNLFTIGSQLASSNENSHTPKIKIEDIKLLEEDILEFEKELPELKNFILPTGTKLASMFHVARAVCRRTERSIVSLSKQKQLDENCVAYVNRLSDLFFTLSRYVNKKEGKEEKEWNSK
ncbi:MAG: cob(I)yrinic acid a,c-diamide adenosyltransferase [Candidatus Aenigmarchaeota archaeon]|nr:cob(I)yrinic acid a,c-diamide adenosyltransferase [Candidatus Aenigmarchaeota archaeon]